MFVLDTNVVSELRSGKRGQSPAVCQWAARQPINTLYLAAVTVLELEIGVLLHERKDSSQGAVLRARLGACRVAFAGRILGFGEATALCCAPLHLPDKKPDRDAAIAATALQHRFTVVTRNVSDFIPMGVALVNPWDPQGASA